MRCAKARKLAHQLLRSLQTQRRVSQKNYPHSFKVFLRYMDTIAKFGIWDKTLPILEAPRVFKAISNRRGVTSQLKVTSGSASCGSRCHDF